jgi:hypothetical protein
MNQHRIQQVFNRGFRPGVRVIAFSDIALDLEKGWVFVNDTAGGQVLVFDQKGALLRKMSV